MEKWLYRLSVAFAVIGLAVSIYMWIFKVTDNENMCVGSSACITVNHSVYSEVYGIPVAAVGTAGYAAILALLFLERSGGYFKVNGTLLIFGLALTGFLFTLYLIYVEVFLIKAYCPFCVTSQVSMTILFILSVIRLVRQPSSL